MNLTKKEKEMISLPPNNGAKKLKPLPEGTIMHLREDNKITLRFERPPTPPPAIGDIEINGKPHLFMEGSEGRFYYNIIDMEIK